MELNNKLAYITHPACSKHEMGAHHPERPERLAAINDLLIASGLDADLQRVEAPTATVEQLLRVHDVLYVDRVLSALPDGYLSLDPDTTMNRHTVRAALVAAGAAIEAVERIATGAATRAFCAVRPPGHHACYDRAMGFCFFNNIVIGVAHAIEALGFRRVAIVDFDVHHGNGTEDIVLRKWPWKGDSSDPAVLFCSTFQHPFYPYTGADTEATNIVSVPLPALTRGAAFREALEASWFPALSAFSPELVMVSAGFDGHAADEMAGWMLQDQDFSWITSRIREVADADCSGRVVSILEGGYELDSLSRCVVEHLRVLA